MRIASFAGTDQSAPKRRARYDRPSRHVTARRHTWAGRAILWCVGALATLSLILGDGFAPAAAANFLPHRAVYDLDLSRSRAISKVTDAEGQFEFEWDDACSGWTVSQRSLIRITYSNGHVVDFGWTLNSWEAKDGLSYRFFIREVYAGSPVEETRGEARLDGAGARGVAIFLKPEAREVELPAGTIFPTHHSLELLDAVAADALPLWRQVFDGSGDNGLYGISAVQSAALQPGQPSSLESDLTRDQRSWRLQLAFFSTDNSQAEPEQEQHLRIFNNGISDQMVFDYGDFALDATLIELEALGPPDC